MCINRINAVIIVVGVIATETYSDISKDAHRSNSQSIHILSYLYAEELLGTGACILLQVCGGPNLSCLKAVWTHLVIVNDKYSHLVYPNINAS